MISEQNDFLFLGNNLAIDFVNTQVADRGEIIELLREPGDVASWAEAAGFSPLMPVKERDMAQIHAFRRALAEIFSQKLDGAPLSKEALGELNRWLPNGAEQFQLKNIKGDLKLIPLHEELSLEQMLGRIAQEAALLLTSGQMKKLKRCGNSKCVLIFLDISRAGKRRWCSMETCGNRAKAAKYYQNMG